MTRLAESTRNKTSICFIAFLVLIMMVSPQKAFAGAWTLDHKSGLILTGIDISASKYGYDDNGNEVTFRDDYFKLRHYTHAAYGLTKRLTIMLDYSVQSARKGLNGQSEQALDNLSFGARWQHYKSTHFAFATELKLGLDDHKAGNKVFSHFKDNHEMTALSLFGYANTIKHIPFYIDVAFGHRFNIKNDHDQWIAELTLGLNPLPKWHITLQSLNSFRQTKTRKIDDNQKIQTSLRYEWKENLHVALNAFKTLKGHNTSKETGLGLALWKHF